MIRRPDEASSEPLWQQVLTDLEQRLARGDFEHGFPSDRELVDSYQVSRHTVREAVRSLKARGVVKRERGRGSFVESGGLSQSLGTLYSLFQAVESAGMEQHSMVLSLGEASDARAAERFGLASDATLVHIERLRYADAVPLALDTVWLPPDIGRELLHADFSRTALYTELQRRSGVVVDRGTEAITALIPGDDLSEVLELEPDEAVLRIDRLGHAGARLIECRVTLVRAGRFTLLSQWPGEGTVVPRVEGQETA
ncbi:MAG: GntR family transcriptional regulator [Egibacteraceae bacterium]